MATRKPVTYRNTDGKTVCYSKPVALLERSPRWERVEDKPPPVAPPTPTPAIPSPPVAPPLANPHPVNPA